MRKGFVKKLKSTATKSLMLALLIFLSVSCEKIFPGEGKPQIYEYTYDQIKKIVVDDIFNVIIIPDSQTRVTIAGGENQLETVSTAFDSLSKTVTFTNSVRMRMLQGYAPIEVKVYTPTLEEIVVSLAATVTFSDTLSANTFRFISNGDISNASILIKAQRVEIENIDVTGKMFVEGQIHKLKIFNRGLSTVDCRNCSAKEIECAQYSMGDCHLKADSVLIWSIFRNGNIFQYKTPSVLQGQRYGSGQLFIIE